MIKKPANILQDFFGETFTARKFEEKDVDKRILLFFFSF